MYGAVLRESACSNLNEVLYDRCYTGERMFCSPWHQATKSDLDFPRHILAQIMDHSDIDMLD